MEYLDIVDKDDRVIGKASRDEIYARSLRHRITHILIFDDQEKMVLQKRSKTVSFRPDHWSTAVGGHVQAGENYEEAALREYQEELGTTSPLTLMSIDNFVSSIGHEKFLGVFKTSFSGPFSPDVEIVSEVKSFSLEEIKDMIKHGEKFHPELIFILNRYFG